MNNMLPEFPPGKAVIFNGYGQPFEVVTSEVPVIKPGEMLVKILYTTLCGSDIHTYCGRRLEPQHVVMGHEIVGDILWIDIDHDGRDLRGEQLKVGDRITWCIFSVPEGVVPPRPDIPQKSDRLFKYGHTLAEGDDVFNGGLASYCVLRENTACIKISKLIPVKVAATISCAHSTVTGALRVAGEIAGKKVLVFGAGLLGLSCLAMCRQAGAIWCGLTDTDYNRLQWADKFGAHNKFLFPAKDNLGLPWPEVDIVFDMTGDPKAMELGIESLATGGCAVWIGAVFNAAPVQVDAQKMVRKLLQIRGLHNYNYDDFLNATLFIENYYTKYPFDELVEEQFQLEDIEEAFSYAVAKKPVRVGIKIS